MKRSLYLLFSLPLLIFAVSTCSVAATKSLEKATFAGGCFWCMEPPFEKLYGVDSVISGFMGGHVKNPTYKQVSSGTSGHLEVVEVRYAKSRVSYQKLLEVFWRQINPTDAEGQFVDRGKQYSTAIFYHNKEQKELAEKSKAAMNKKGIFGKSIVTPITEATTFYPAGQYHQDYYKKNPFRYKFYRKRSGRDQYLDRIWGKDMEAKKYDKAYTEYDKKKKLTKMQYWVTQEDGTEKPFANEYWDNKQTGIYVDIVSGEPLFSSIDKYKSGTGWPSFTRPLVAGNIVRKVDKKFFSERIEIRSMHADSHLGHVFDDGPPPTGLRYCINSASLRFVPVKDFKKEGYSKYQKLFEMRISTPRNERLLHTNKK